MKTIDIVHWENFTGGDITSGGFQWTDDSDGGEWLFYRFVRFAEEERLKPWQGTRIRLVTVDAPFDLYDESDDTDLTDWIDRTEPYLGVDARKVRLVCPESFDHSKRVWWSV